MRSVFELKRDGLRFLVGINDCDSGRERNFYNTFLQHIALQLDFAGDEIVVDLQFQIGAFQRVGKRWKFRLLRGLAGEFDEVVVFLE